MTTALGIINRSLTEIAARQPIDGVFPTFDNSAAGIAAGQLYAPAVETLLRQQDWEFSRAVETLISTGRAPPLNWAYEYIYPITCLRVRQVVPATFDPNDPVAVTWDVGNVVVSGIIYQTEILSNGTGYAVNDTGIVLGSNEPPATYKVLTVGGGGQVLTYSITFEGSGYVVGPANMQIGGAQRGVGTGFSIEILSTRFTSQRVIWTNEGISGVIGETVILFNGVAYNLGDTGTILGTTGERATYLVTNIGAAGAVTDLILTSRGSGYTVAAGGTTATGGDQPGIGTGLVVDIVTTVISGVDVVMTTTDVTENDWDPLFQETMVRYLGSMLAMPVGGRPDFSREMLGQAGGLGQAGRDRDS